MERESISGGRTAGYEEEPQEAAEEFDEEEFDDECGDLQEELTEAIEAGNYLLTVLRHAERSLASARGWGVVDMLGGGGFVSFIKHSKVRHAENDLAEIQGALHAFQRELRDLQGIDGLKVEIGPLLTFLDIFSDNILWDLVAQSRIQRARREIAEAIDCVECYLETLLQYC